jgi:hypothetical protein
MWSAVRLGLIAFASHVMDVLEFARQQIVASRQYTQKLLDLTPKNLWFTIPQGIGTHIAWQVGHLAMAQFRLCIYFVRPVLPEDEAVISDEFMAYFRKGTQPCHDSSAYPPLQEICGTFDAMHEHVLSQWWRYDEIAMNENARVHPHLIVTSRLDALTWAARHEMVHAGQISLIRRLLGCERLW